MKSSLQVEVDQFFQAIMKSDVAKALVTRSAICQARKKVKHGAYIALRDAICSFLDRHCPMKTFHGHRVLAIDGSTIRPPDNQEMRNHFGKASPKDGSRAMARASILHDPLNRITYDALISSYHQGEESLAWEHLEAVNLPDHPVFLMDRGYSSFSFLKSILDQGFDFCVRIRSNLKVVKLLKASGLKEGIFQNKPCSKAKRLLSRGSSLGTPFNVRVLEIKMKGREPIYLMTSLLDSKKIPSHDLADLYHVRWQVEESFKTKKCRLMIEEFSGTSPETVLQDFHAKVFGECLTEALVLTVSDSVEEYSTTTHGDYKVCFTQALSKMKNVLCLLFLRTKFRSLINDLLEAFTKTLVEVVPNRHFRRKGSGKNRVKIKDYAKAYKPTR